MNKLISQKENPQKTSIFARFLQDQSTMELKNLIKIEKGRSFLSDTIYADSAGESDPIFSEWDKSSGISITESQISDLGNYIETETQSLSDVAARNNNVNTQLKNVSEPTDDQDAATKAYVDALEDRVFDIEFALGDDTISDYDGNSYKIVKIGEQYWMAENLRATHYPDGTPITLVDNATQWEKLGYGKGYCWYNFDSIAYAQTYGALYNWHAALNNGTRYTPLPNKVQGVCPDGWHVPNQDEWNELQGYLGGDVVAGGKLKESGTDHWSSPNTGATNESGFNALPGGFVLSIVVSNNLKLYAYWWSYNQTSSFFYTVSYNSTEFKIRSRTFSDGMSVRCIKD